MSDQSTKKVRPGWGLGTVGINRSPTPVAWGPRTDAQEGVTAGLVAGRRSLLAAAWWVKCVLAAPVATMGQVITIEENALNSIQEDGLTPADTPPATASTRRFSARPLNRQMSDLPDTDDDAEEGAGAEGEAAEGEGAEGKVEELPWPEGCVGRVRLHVCRLVLANPFNNTIMVLIVLNTLVMASEHYGQPQTLIDFQVILRS